MTITESMFVILLYLVIALTLIAVWIYIASCLWGGVRALFPEVTMFSHRIERARQDTKKGREAAERYKNNIYQEVRRGKKDALRSIIWLFVFLPILFLHYIFLIRTRRKN